MNDKQTTVEELKTLVYTFIDEREWFQFHSPKNLSISIALEAAELMEKFQWCDNNQSYKDAEKNKDAVAQELADIFVTGICFARSVGIDICEAIENKMKLNGEKYPVHKAKGVYTKYDKL